MVRGKGNQFQSADPPDFFVCLFLPQQLLKIKVGSFYFRSYQEDNSGPVIWDRYIKKMLEYWLVKVKVKCQVKTRALLQNPTFEQKLAKNLLHSFEI